MEVFIENEISESSAKRYNKEKNVYDAANERIDFIFKNFKRIYISFSGGKDSGVMINLVLDYMKKNGITEKVGVMILDNEANYEYSLKFMHNILRENLDCLDVYWCCLPITLPCTVSSYAIEWQCWGVKDSHKWIRPMPKDDYIVNFQNHKFDFFKENMSYDEFWDENADDNGFCRCMETGELLRAYDPYYIHHVYTKGANCLSRLDKENLVIIGFNADNQAHNLESKMKLHPHFLEVREKMKIKYNQNKKAV
jgi:3'-phosphoadenosine 5'-phosphosulfate sulfotransferase (PAPS reductase)/FAD synthetase